MFICNFYAPDISLRSVTVSLFVKSHYLIYPLGSLASRTMLQYRIVIPRTRRRSDRLRNGNLTRSDKLEFGRRLIPHSDLFFQGGNYDGWVDLASSVT